MSRAQYHHLSGSQLRDLRAAFPNVGDLFLVNDLSFRKAAHRVGLNPRDLLVAMRRDRSVQMRRRWIALGCPVAQATAADTVQIS